LDSDSLQWFHQQGDHRFLQEHLTKSDEDKTELSSASLIIPTTKSSTTHNHTRAPQPIQKLQHISSTQSSSYNNHSTQTTNNKPKSPNAKTLFKDFNPLNSHFKLNANSGSKTKKDINIGVVTFVKDDADILPYWLDYHTAVFGAAHIVVIDHDSRNNATLETLKHWQTKGVRVEHTTESYILKGTITYRVLQKYFAKTADLFIPLDVDEFLIYFDPQHTPIASRTSIQRALQDIWQTRKSTNHCWGLLHNYNSYPTQVNDTVETIRYFAPYQRSVVSSKKIIAKTRSFLGLDHGNHCPVIAASNCSYCQGVSDIGLLHFHTRNPKETAKRAIIDLINLKHLRKDATLDNISKYRNEIAFTMEHHPTGAHKAKELLHYIDEGEYGILKSIKQKDLMNIGTIKDLIEKLKMT
jgi:hypothetical protein